MNPTLTHDLQQRLGYHFANPDLLRLALTHSSAGVQNYERLEHLGDAVPELAVTYWLYRDFPHFGPGQMSILRAECRLSCKRVRAESLARFARQSDRLRCTRAVRPMSDGADAVRRGVARAAARGADAKRRLPRVLSL